MPTSTLNFPIDKKICGPKAARSFAMTILRFPTRQVTRQPGNRPAQGCTCAAGDSIPCDTCLAWRRIYQSAMAACAALQAVRDD
jgi:hypothetical protein